MLRTIEDKDKAYLWHPFTQMKGWLKEPQMVIKEAKGIKLIDEDGKEYYDGVSSLWVNIHGHQKKELDEAILSQLQKVAHTTMLGLINEPASIFAEKLLAVAPKNLKKVFYSDDGSTGIEVALKMAFQYYQHQGKPNKKKFVALESAYHGDTVGSVSVGGIDLFHRTFKELLFNTHKVPSPSCYHCKLTTKQDCCMQCLEKIEEILIPHHEEIAGVIIEPLVQAAAGMLMAPKGYLKKLRELTTKYDVLLIVDEVATGFGRTGKLFAVEHEQVEPDLMVLSKGITGGYLPLAVTLSTDEIYNAFLGDYEEKKTFYHGHSYTGNPLACAVAIANLEIFAQEKVIEGLEPKIIKAQEILQDIRELKYVGDARQCGLIMGIELMKDKEAKVPFSFKEAMGAKVCLECRKFGLIIRPIGDVIIFMPPLASSVVEIEDMLKIIYKVIKSITEEGENDNYQLEPTDL